MSCNRIETDGMRYLDGEMSDDERAAFEEHLSACGECRQAMNELGSVERLTGMMKIRDPQDDFWEAYWKKLFRRLERKTGWLLMIAGAALIILYALWRGVTDFGEITFVKVVAVIVAAGFVMLLISVIRERLHQYKTDRYKDIER
ncbi:MAG: zf-HC2 domain-containing protein [Candidatus Krumholzibacteria bacterium]|nr:zf-HC2 domain-containing protein [Candidatus Krumholzibacteria bacterium]